MLKKHSITQADFSRRFCISSALISRWCSGERRCPTYVLSMADELLTIDAEKSKIIVDGKEVAVERILKDGTNYVKVRDLAAALDLEVSNKGNIAVLNHK